MREQLTIKAMNTVELYKIRLSKDSELCKSLTFAHMQYYCSYAYAKKIAEAASINMVSQLYFTKSGKIRAIFTN